MFYVIKNLNYTYKLHGRYQPIVFGHPYHIKGQRLVYPLYAYDYSLIQINLNVGMLNGAVICRCIFSEI